MVTVKGTGFVGVTAVKLGTVEATEVSVLSSTELTAEIPAGGAGTVDLSVKTPNGTSPSLQQRSLQVHAHDQRSEPELRLSRRSGVHRDRVRLRGRLRRNGVQVRLDQSQGRGVQLEHHMHGRDPCARRRCGRSNRHRQQSEQPERRALRRIHLRMILGGWRAAKQPSPRRTPDEATPCRCRVAEARMSTDEGS